MTVCESVLVELSVDYVMVIWRIRNCLDVCRILDVVCLSSRVLPQEEQFKVELRCLNSSQITAEMKKIVRSVATSCVPT